MMARLPAPEPDHINAEWWGATSRNVLLIQTCRTCDHRQHYPRPLCIACGSSDLGWTEAAGHGTVQSWTVIRRSPYEDLAAPYVLALVDLAEGVRLLTHLVDSPAGDIACEAAVALRWIKAPGDNPFQLPVFAIQK
jgi:uncharacterized OB-fold protein